MVRIHPSAHILKYRCAYFEPVKILPLFTTFSHSPWFVVLFLSLFLPISFYQSITAIDPDLGWHIRLSEYIATYGLPVNDPFSYTMTSHKYIDHEWVFHVLFFPLYQTLHLYGLAVILSGITVSTLYILWKRYQTAVLLPLLLFASGAILRFGIRPQLYSWLLFFLFLCCIQAKRWNVWRFAIPFLILLWVNVHASVVLPLVLLFIFIFSRFVTKKGEWKDIIVLLSSFAVTLINPYGGYIWQEIVRQVQEPLVHQHIQEWGRFYTRPELSHLFALTLGGMFLVRYKKLFALHEFIFSGVLLLLSMMALRHVPLFLIWIGFIITKGYTFLEQEASKNISMKRRMKIFWSLLLGIGMCFFCIESFFSIVQARALRESVYYPQDAVVWLHQQPLKGRVFAPYEWGGYLLWKFPSQKVFIDGRMPSFRFNAPDGESDSAFEDYLAIIDGKETEELLAKYSVSTILWKHKKDSSQEEITLLVQTSNVDNKPNSFHDVVKGLGWSVVYSDDVSVIYQKYSPNSK